MLARASLAECACIFSTSVRKGARHAPAPARPRTQHTQHMQVLVCVCGGWVVCVRVCGVCGGGGKGIHDHLEEDLVLASGQVQQAQRRVHAVQHEERALACMQPRDRAWVIRHVRKALPHLCLHFDCSGAAPSCPPPLSTLSLSESESRCCREARAFLQP